MLYENTLVIEAPLDRLWRLTTDIAAWPAFLPTVQRLERLDDGPVRVGSRARIKQPAQTEAVWTVTRLEPQREFTWETKRMGIRMIGGHHLEEAPGGGVRNRLTIEVTGRGAGLFMALVGAAVRRSIREENAAFQRALLS
jgi:uncharacterized membrane protein